MIVVALDTIQSCIHSRLSGKANHTAIHLSYHDDTHGSKMQDLVGNALLSQLYRVGIRQEGKFSFGKPRSCNVEQGNVFVKPKQSVQLNVEWLPLLEDSVARKMGKAVIPEALRNSGWSRHCRGQSCRVAP